MKGKKNNENEKKALLNGEPANAAKELEDDDLEQVAGGVSNPFERPRMGFQPIDGDLRNNG